ncbi:hypothetical protein Trichorick_01507 (plasmid) [Candidatus Trichorickettsia mobilis]|uniref:hypothetical protein n=1 Tax=Candidatus Trichorickettsia mobilis TaxID=1346319 RepID=UPI002B260D6B|nr:hypothetical protein [Candidatus Trichorickettsia mobilis]WPY01593.1 hypothetical protein Trichorick_01507 [Candidatus Trichorickettsia mobilis]
MTRFYNSGLYLTPFFTKHKEVNLTLFDNEYLHDEIEYNADLFAEHFKGSLVEQCKYNPSRKVNNDFLKYIPTWPRYYEPLVFNEKIALECGLIPFVLKVDRLCLIAVSVCGSDLSPRLDAYQALTDNTIDENSYLFSDFDYFQEILGKNLTQKVLEAISYTE